MTVILLDIAVVTKDYPGCLPKPFRVSIWSLRRAQTEFASCCAKPAPGSLPVSAELGAEAEHGGSRVPTSPAT